MNVGANVCDFLDVRVFVFVQILCLAFSPDGSTLACGNADCNVYLLHVPSLQVAHLRAFQNFSVDACACMYTT